MKKILFGILFLGSLLFGEAGMSVGYSSFNVGKDAGTGGDIAFKYSNYYDIMYWGGRFGFEYGSIKDTTVSSKNQTSTVHDYTADIRLGITPVSNTIAVYGIFAVMYQSVSNIDFGGFGTGAGMDFKFNKNISMSIDYTSFNMSPTQSPAFADYKFDRTLCSINFTY